MEKNLKIEKLSDIVVWADGIIRDGGYYEEKYRSDATTAYCNVKAYELWRIRDVALKGIERHAVYSNALNKDIAAKAAKIELMQQEIDGRKEGYHALKEKMDSSLAKKDEEIEKLNKDVEKRCKDIVSQSGTICNLKKELDARGEEIKGLVKERDEINMQHAALAVTSVGMIKERDEKIEELTHRIDNYKSWNEDIKKLKEEIEKLKVDLIHEREKNEKLAKDHAELENDMRKVSKDRDGYREEAFKAVNQERIRTDQLRATESKVEELWKEIEKLKKEDDHGRKGFKEYIKWIVKEEEEKFKESWKARLNEELEAIFKEEETEVNDIPCGDDSIE